MAAKTARLKVGWMVQCLDSLRAVLMEYKLVLMMADMMEQRKVVE